MKKKERTKTDSARMHNMAGTLGPLCDDCRQYAAKYYLWNTDSLEGVEEVAALALDSISGKASTPDYLESLTKVLKKIPYSILRDITKIGIDIAVFRCPRDICKSACRKYEHWQ